MIIEKHPRIGDIQYLITALIIALRQNQHPQTEIFRKTDYSYGS